MKRIFAAVISLLFAAACFSPFAILIAFAEGESAQETDGLYTPIPYVPAYTGTLNSKSRILLMDLETGNILIEQNSTLRAYPASTTKIMTALLLIENTTEEQWDIPLDPLDEVNSTESAEGSQLGLIVGDQPTRRDLLYGLLLPSGCDCAYVTACMISGSEAAFVKKMNARASELGMSNSRYENSYGLASGMHHTTAEDMAILIRHAMQYPMFRKTVSTAYQTLYIKNGGGTRTVSARNTNHLLHKDSYDYYPYAIGVKTGTSNLADHCLTAAAKKGDLEILSIVMNTDDNSERYGFTRELLDWGFEFYSSEGGLYSMTLTNALFKAAPDGCGVYSVPETSAENNAPSDTIAAGAGIRVGAYHYDADGKLWYMIWQDGVFRWAKAEEMEFVTYINDIQIESGKTFNGTSPVGEDKPIDSIISSRHKVQVVTFTVYDSNGSAVAGGSSYPSASCTHSLEGSTIDQDTDFSMLPPGDYTCVTRVEAEASVPDSPVTESIAAEETSLLRIVDSESDVCAVSYNANTGHGAPLGCFAEKGESVVISDTVPEKIGCAFAGWNTAADGSGSRYMPGDTLKTDESVTLYAQWSKAKSEWFEDVEINIYEMFITLGGTIKNDAGITSAEISVFPASGDTSPLFTKGIAYTSNVYKLSDVNGELGSILFDEGDYTLVIKASVGVGEPETVCEKTFNINKKSIYVLGFLTNGGTFAQEPLTMTVLEGETFGRLPVPEREGYVFDGWYDENGAAVNENTIVPDHSGDSITLTAHWHEAEASNSPGNGNDTSPRYKPPVPLWVFLAGGAVLVAAIIGLMVYIIKKPDKSSEE